MRLLISLIDGTNLKPVCPVAPVIFQGGTKNIPHAYLNLYLTLSFI